MKEEVMNSAWGSNKRPLIWASKVAEEKQMRIK